MEGVWAHLKTANVELLAAAPPTQRYELSFHGHFHPIGA